MRLHLGLLLRQALRHEMPQHVALELRVGGVPRGDGRLRDPDDAALADGVGAFWSDERLHWAGGE